MTVTQFDPSIIETIINSNDAYDLYIGKNIELYDKEYIVLSITNRNKYEKTIQLKETKYIENEQITCVPIYSACFEITLTKMYPVLCDLFLDTKHLDNTIENKYKLISLIRTTAEKHSEFLLPITIQKAKQLVDKQLSLLYSDVPYGIYKEFKKDFEDLGAPLTVIVTKYVEE